MIFVIRSHFSYLQMWAVGGAILLLACGLISPAEGLTGINRGTDVYLFLTGMMLLAETAREENLFDWLEAHATNMAKGSGNRLFLLMYITGTLVTVFLSNDATAVVLTPAVIAATKAAKVKNPLPYLFTRLQAKAIMKPQPHTVAVMDLLMPCCKTEESISISPVLLSASTITKRPATNSSTDQVIPCKILCGLFFAACNTMHVVNIPVMAVGRPSCTSNAEAISKIIAVAAIPHKAVLPPFVSAGISMRVSIVCRMFLRCTR